MVVGETCVIGRHVKLYHGVRPEETTEAPRGGIESESTSLGVGAGGSGEQSGEGGNDQPVSERHEASDGQEPRGAIGRAEGARDSPPSGRAPVMMSGFSMGRFISRRMEPALDRSLPSRPMYAKAKLICARLYPRWSPQKEPENREVDEGEAGGGEQPDEEEEREGAAAPTGEHFRERGRHGGMPTFFR